MSVLFCLSFEERISSSSILCSLDHKYLVKLSSYLYPVLQSQGRSSFLRCWHALTDGWASSTSHSNCDGKGPTVTIVQVGSYIFVGYTDKSWGGMYQFITALIKHRSSLRIADVFTLFASLPPKNIPGGREATTGNTSAICRLTQIMHVQHFRVDGRKRF